MVAVRWVASAASRVNGAEVVPATVAVVRPLSWESVCAVAAVRPVNVGVVSLMVVVSGIEMSLLNYIRYIFLNTQKIIDEYTIEKSTKLIIYPKQK